MPAIGSAFIRPLRLQGRGQDLEALNEVCEGLIKAIKGVGEYLDAQSSQNTASALQESHMASD